MSAKEPKDIMSSLLKIVPQLGEEGFDTWLMALRMAAFHYDWFDPEKYPDDDWTPAEMKMEDKHKTQVQNRKAGLLHHHVPEIEGLRAPLRGREDRRRWGRVQGSLRPL